MGKDLAHRAKHKRETFLEITEVPPAEFHRIEHTIFPEDFIKKKETVLRTCEPLMPAMRQRPECANAFGAFSYPIWQTAGSYAFGIGPFTPTAHGIAQSA